MRQAAGVSGTVSVFGVRANKEWKGLQTETVSSFHSAGGGEAKNIDTPIPRRRRAFVLEPAKFDFG
jgi:hypothetical protein